MLRDFGLCWSVLCSHSEVNGMTKHPHPPPLSSLAKRKRAVFTQPEAQMYYCTTEMDFVALLPLAKPAHRLTLSSSILILLHVICCISGPCSSSHPQTTHNKTSGVFFVFLICSHFALPTFREIVMQ